MFRGQTGKIHFLGRGHVRVENTYLGSSDKDEKVLVQNPALYFEQTWSVPASTAGLMIRSSGPFDPKLCLVLRARAVIGCIIAPHMSAGLKSVASWCMVELGSPIATSA